MALFLGTQSDPLGPVEPGFQVLAKDPEGSARLGVFRTPHGDFTTPVFIPVGTQATVKAMSPEELRDLGIQIVLCNAYHLHLRPGEKVIKELGGLHRFMNWPGPILTDSGGYQVFSLAPLRRITEQGVFFRSHLDGTPLFLGPEDAVQIQRDLGVDVAMCLDECIPYDVSRQYAEESTNRTMRWALRCKNSLDEDPKGMSLFGIVQGGLFPDLRRRSAQELVEIGFHGYAIGGLSVGESPAQRAEMVQMTLEHLPHDAPRYLMGVGSPEELVKFVCMGVDMFDCVLPTRCGRNGLLFTRKGKLDIRHAQHARSEIPVEESCGCYTCTHYSRAYLRHLYMSKEILGARLNTVHNLFYYSQLMQELQTAIKEGRLSEYQLDFFRQRSSGDTDQNNVRGKEAVD